MRAACTEEPFPSQGKVCEAEPNWDGVLRWTRLSFPPYMSAIEGPQDVWAKGKKLCGGLVRCRGAHHRTAALRGPTLAVLGRQLWWQGRTPRAVFLQDESRERAKRSPLVETACPGAGLGCLGVSPRYLAPASGALALSACLLEAAARRPALTPGPLGLTPGCLAPAPRGLELAPRSLAVGHGGGVGSNWV